jgi:hypothetical protein
MTRVRLHRALRKLLSVPIEPSNPQPQIKALFKTEAYIKLEHLGSVLGTDKKEIKAEMTNSKGAICLKRKLSSSPLSSTQQTPTPPFSPATILKRARMSSGSDELTTDKGSKDFSNIEKA